MQSKTHSKKVWTTRLMLAEPDVAYRELEAYGEELGNQRCLNGNQDNDLERALLSRGDRLIDLGLAQFGGCSEVVQALYDKAHCASKNAQESDYFLSLRLACLANRSDDFFASFVKNVDIPAIINREGYEELGVLLRNPCISEDALASVFRHDGPFGNVSEDLWLACVEAASHNTRININEDSESGPDMGIWNIHKGIYQFLCTAPINERGYWLVDCLLDHLDPRNVQVCGDPLALIERWKGLAKVMEKASDTSGYDGLTWSDRTEMLCCGIAALYGWTSGEKGRCIPVGTMDSAKLELRCSYYGNASLTAKEMSKGFARDGDKFIRAALDNSLCLWSRERRKFIEENNCGLDRYYRFRCEQFSKGLMAIDPTPVSEAGEATEEDSKTSPSKEIKLLEKINRQIDGLTKRFEKYERRFFWVLLATILVAEYLRKT